VATISNLNIDAAADYQSTVTISSIASDGTESAFDLTNYTATASLRKNYASSSKTDFTCNIDSPATNGNVTISLTDVQTAALDRGRYVWDMTVTSSGGTITRVVEGVITVNPSVTRTS
tara:strand:- start:1783 stop:2136 length:354 start_codon:yes stop_codon:yes gene_type:complete